MSEERVPVMLKPVRSKAITWCWKSQVTPDQVQWVVLRFHDERDDCGSSEMADLMEMRDWFSGKVAAAAEVLGSKWRKRRKRVRREKPILGYLLCGLKKVCC